MNTKTRKNVKNVLLRLDYKHVSQVGVIIPLLIFSTRVNMFSGLYMTPLQGCLSFLILYILSVIIIENAAALVKSAKCTIRERQKDNEARERRSEICQYNCGELKK